MVEMTIYGVSFDLVGKQPIVLLKTADGNRYLPIWIGHPEAAAILMKLQGATAQRPLTHDLLMNILGELDAEVVRVTVTELRENTFHASITIAQNGSEVEIDSRSSDAIAVAVRAQAPIFAADDVIEESAIEMEGDDVNEAESVDGWRLVVELALRQREQLEVERTQAVVAERPVVLGGPGVDHRALAVGVDERDPVRVLVALQLGDELEPPVDRVEDQPVELGDPLAEPRDFVVGV